MRLVSAELTSVSERNRRFRFVVFFVRMWLWYARRRLSFPVPVILNRLAALRLVLIFGIVASFLPVSKKLGGMGSSFVPVYGPNAHATCVRPADRCLTI